MTKNDIANSRVYPQDGVYGITYREWLVGMAIAGGVISKEDFGRDTTRGASVVTTLVDAIIAELAKERS